MNYLCTVCFRHTVKQKDHDVCIPCNRELNMIEAEFMRQESEKANKRKCRECGMPTGASRYFTCLNCEPDAWRPDENEFESCDDLSGFEPPQQAKARAAKLEAAK